MINKFILSTLFIATLSSAMGQSPRGKISDPRQNVPDNRSLVRPYLNLKDSRALGFVGEVSYYKNDTLVSSSKAKWDGSILITQADGRTIDISITEVVVPNMIIYSDLMADIFNGSEAHEVTVRMDKSGKIVDVPELEEAILLYTEQKEKMRRAEEKMSKEERKAFADSLKTAMIQGDKMKGTLIEYAKTFLDIYGKLVPTNSDTIKNTVKINPKRFFADATKSIDAQFTQYTSDAKGGKFTLNEIYEYDYKAMDEFLAEFESESARFDGIIKVRDSFQTQFDSKLGWPVKLYEEFTVTKGPFKVVYKWTVKFIKE